MRRALLVILVLACATACGASPTAGDGDGGNPPVCTGAPALGCPCEAGQPAVSCFDGPSEAASVPPCRKGLRSCDPTIETWGQCEGQVLPALETCDGEDNDCDGTIDDGVVSLCGDCTPGCDHSIFGDPGAFPMPGDPLPPGAIDVDSDGVGLDPMGDLILDSDSIELHFLWVANAGEGTVSKLDTVTGQEVARYASLTRNASAVVDVMGYGIGSLQPWGGINSPSRTAIDYYGNVWVGNRAFGYQPSATKIMNDEGDCIDRNGNGVIDTSREVNGTPGIQLTDPGEFFAEEDECIAFTVIVGTNNGYARAVAIDGGVDPGDPGNAWIGIFNEQAFYQLNGTDGTLVQRVPPSGASGISPYGAAIDGSGQLWAPHGAGGGPTVWRIDTVTGTSVATYGATGLGCGGSYGIAIDLMGKVWIGGWSCASAIRFDPATTSWSEVAIPGYYGAGWGARGLGGDLNGNMWVALHTHSFTGGAVARVNTTSLTSTGVWDVAGVVPVGAAVDFDGNVWTVNQSTSNASRVHVDPTTLEPSPHPTTGNIVDTFAVGNAPYTYSDFTGLALRTVTRPSGDYIVNYEGCPDGEQAHWDEVDFDATAPAGTAVQIWVRAGDDLATLPTQPQYGPWTVPPANLQVPPGPVPDSRYLQLTIRLISEDRMTSPIVHSYELRWTCPSVPVGSPEPDATEDPVP